MMKVIMKFAQVVGLLVLVGGVIWLGYWGVTSLRVPKHHHSVETISPREELNRESPIKLEPRAGSDIGFVYEAFLSPHQEGGEEEETPDFIPKAFHSSLPSVARKDRKSHGHSIISFTKDLSRAYVYLAVSNLDVENMNMLHIHCGRPGQLGPILVDFALIGNIQNYLSDGVMKIEVKNEDIVATANHGEGLIGAITAGCPIFPAITNDKVKTIAGMEYIARQGDLYFNIHTKAQTFFGDIRGQFYLAPNGK